MWCHAASAQGGRATRFCNRKISDSARRLQQSQRPGRKFVQHAGMRGERRSVCGLADYISNSNRSNRSTAPLLPFIPQRRGSFMTKDFSSMSPCMGSSSHSSVHTLARASSLGLRFGGGGAMTWDGVSRRDLSTRRGGGRPLAGRTLPEKIFAGTIVVVLAAWGLVFGAITLLLLPFIGVGLFLIRRNFQRGGVSRNVVAGLARKMAERGGFPGGGVGGVRGGGGKVEQWMQRAPSQGMWSSMLARMLGGGIRGMELVGVLRSEVKRRALRHPGLSSALGGEIREFSDVEMSTVGTAGGNFAPRGSKESGPSRVIKARLRFSGRRPGAGASGWVEVKVSDWEDLKGEDGTDGMEYDRVFVTLDNGKTFDLSRENSGGKTSFSRGRGGSDRKDRGQDSKGKADGQPVEAEFHDK